jgi:heterodisulfide reductase subunit A
MKKNVKKQPAFAPGTNEWISAVRTLQEKGGSLQVNRETWALEPTEMSPCNVDCPALINVKGYVGLIAEERFTDALDLVRERNPFPGICGRVCAHPCEEACNRADFGGPVAIRALKRFVADYELRHGRPKREIPKPTGEKVAIVGAGPAGLTAAADLARLNYQVTIFEASNSPGGMMRWAIPRFRLPKEIIKSDISAISDLGVEIKLNKRLGKDFSLADLKKQGFKAVFLALGAGKSLKLGVKGEGAAGVEDALAFLRSASGGKGKNIGRRVIVVGGGNSAIDAARTAVRCGATNVSVIYRRSEKEMPAAPEEIEAAREEGVLFHYLVAPVQIESKSGRVRKVRCIHMELGPPDESGRSRPVPIMGTEFELDANAVIAAVGQTTDADKLAKDGLRITKRGTIEVKPETLETGVEGVFAGGDLALGPHTIVEAIGHGHIASRSIDRYIRKLPLAPEKPFEKPSEVQAPNQQISQTRRAKPAESAPEKRRKNFAEYESSLTIEEAVAEAERCLRCGPCRECRHCLVNCRNEWVIVTSPGLDQKTYNLPIRSDRHQWKLQPAAVAEGRMLLKDASGTENEFKIEVKSILAKIDPDICRGCGECAAVCAYDAPTPTGEPAHAHPYIIDEVRCKGCGACLAVCPVGAIELGFYSPAFYSDIMQRAIEEANL